jgi:hypothetical protein
MLVQCATLTLAAVQFCFEFLLPSCMEHLRCQDAESLLSCLLAGTAICHLRPYWIIHQLGSFTARHDNKQPTFYRSPYKKGVDKPDLTYPRLFRFCILHQGPIALEMDHNLTRMADFSVHIFKIFCVVSFVFLQVILFPLSQDGAWMDQVWSITRRRDMRVTTGVVWTRLCRLLGVGVFFTAQHFNTQGVFLLLLGRRKMWHGI